MSSLLFPRFPPPARTKNRKRILGGSVFIQSFFCIFFPHLPISFSLKAKVTVVPKSPPFHEDSLASEETSFDVSLGAAVNGVLTGSPATGAPGRFGDTTTLHKETSSSSSVELLLAQQQTPQHGGDFDEGRFSAANSSYSSFVGVSTRVSTATRAAFPLPKLFSSFPFSSVVDTLMLVLTALLKSGVASQHTGLLKGVHTALRVGYGGANGPIRIFCIIYTIYTPFTHDPVVFAIPTSCTRSLFTHQFTPKKTDRVHHACVSVYKVYSRYVR